MTGTINHVADLHWSFARNVFLEVGLEFSVMPPFCTQEWVRGADVRCRLLAVRALGRTLLRKEGCAVPVSSSGRSARNCDLLPIAGLRQRLQYLGWKAL